LNRTKATLIRIALVCAGESLLLGGLWKGIVDQTRGVNQAVTGISDLKDPSPYRAALLGHLGKMHLGLRGYLRSPDASLEKQVAQSRLDFEASLPEFERENPKLFPPTAGEEIRRTFGVFQEAIERTLEANARRMEQRSALDRNFAQMIEQIDRNLRPIIRKNQPDGEERSEAVLNIENQLRAWQQNLAQAWANPSDAGQNLALENDSRGGTYLERYARMELLPRERKVQRQISALWVANSEFARTSFALENVVRQTETSMDADREAVISTLHRFLPAMPPAQLERRKQAYLRSMRLHMAGAGGLALLSLGSLLAAALWIYRLTGARPPVTEAAYHAPPHEPTLQMDLQGTITAWNPSASSLYGYSADEILGKSIGRLFESESEINRLYRLIQTAEQATFQTTHKTKAGAPILVRVDFRPLLDSAGRTMAIGLVCSRR
jgi:PAS domain S-box-containing protein